MQSVLKNTKIFDDEIIEFIIDVFFILFLKNSFVVEFRKKLIILDVVEQI